MVGFAMYEVLNGIGFIIRIMIDRRYQRQGFGKAAIAEVIRLLRRDPAVETISTSHLRHNDPAARLFASLGFQEWNPEWASDMPHERVLRLPEAGAESGGSADADKPRS
jgi:diamine N-acetyltransferase